MTAAGRPRHSRLGRSHVGLTNSARSRSEFASTVETPWHNPDWLSTDGMVNDVSERKDRNDTACRDCPGLFLLIRRRSNSEEVLVRAGELIRIARRLPTALRSGTAFEPATRDFGVTMALYAVFTRSLTAMECKCYPSCDPGQKLAVSATSMVGRKGKKLPSPLAVVRLGLAVHWTTGSLGVCAR
ncbi:hypothetical protein EXIGLDRAFT_312758 [Exidia glandulosa HHB12029]|uniref:Uncharacterized protein n=1 Tax=Exidia glandulosa HHB12029 TaxID=1314781 RepID=A0A165CYZ1_EXIGL|nr:hypothetical protein EXIGLDRAFT_312758 [Exidia glandulosa HHB12029]